MSAHIGNLLRLDHVDAGYDGTVVLRDLSLDVHDNQFSAVVGPSGAGKTTLLRLLLGTVKPSAGTVRRRDGLRTAYVPQLETVNWDFPLTVFEGARRAPRCRGRAARNAPRSAACWSASASGTCSGGTSASCPAGSSSGCSWPGP